MLKNRVNGLIFCVLGFFLVIFVGCNSFANEMKNKEQLTIYEQEVEETPLLEEEAFANQTEEKKPIAITQEQFIKLVADYRKDWKYVGKKPCVIDFYADWCRPCKMMEPSFAKMAEKYAGKVNFYKINVDYNKDISAAYQVSGIPTLFFCSQDGKLTRISGLLSEDQINANVEMILSKK